MKASKAGAIYEYVVNHPDVTTTAVAQALGYTMPLVSSALTVMYGKGLVDRRPVRKLPTGVTVYSYFAKSANSARDRILAESNPPAATPPVPPKKTISLDALLSTFVDSLVDNVVEGIRIKLAPALETRIQAMIADSLPKLPAPPIPEIVVAEEKQPRPRVGIVGLHDKTASLIRDEFKRELDIEFADQDQLNRVRSLGVRCPITFVMTAYCSHKVSDVLKSNGANVRLVPGGTSALKDALTEYYVGAK